MISLLAHLVWPVAHDSNLLTTQQFSIHIAWEECVRRSAPTGRAWWLLIFTVIASCVASRGRPGAQSLLHLLLRGHRPAVSEGPEKIGFFSHPGPIHLVASWGFLSGIWTNPQTMGPNKPNILQNTKIRRNRRAALYVALLFSHFQ